MKAKLFDPAIPLLGIYPKDYKLCCYKDTCMCMFTAALFTTAKTWTQPKCPSMVDWIKQMWHIHTMECYMRHRKERDHVLYRDTDGVGSHHPQQTKVGTENQITCVLTSKWELNDVNTRTQGREQPTLGPVGGEGQKESIRKNS